MSTKNKISDQPVRFPKDFLWGSAISAHQTEGNNVNSDWWAWENSAGRAAALKARGKSLEDHRSGEACDFYHRYDSDFALAESLNQNAIRISVEWARIEPKSGEWRGEEVRHYVEVLKSAQKHGLKTFVTLFHFTLPLWFAESGGFAQPGNVDRFVAYVEKLAAKLDPYVDFWLTLNEPEIYTSHAYYFGIYPPQHKSLRESFRVVNNLIAAHRRTYAVLKKQSTKPVGLAYHLLDVVAVNVLSSFNRLFFHYVANEYVLNRTVKFCDFIGVNYYNHVHLAWWGRRMQSQSRHETSDLGWGIHPEGIERVLVGLKRYRKPVYITENGVADAADTRREKFIKDHLRYVQRAIARGVNVRGYLHWSLIDNFEWHHGFRPRFGLVAVDYATQKRTVRDSARAYASICKNNSLSA
ncbi:MAG: glycoside hydrolase family 1 protein [Patescibacteria group bacterium]|nr:glycoside hydrolase family 1 protein [Patescibacteria group bacterium]